MIPRFKINRSKPQPWLNRAFLWQFMKYSNENLSNISELITNEYGEKADGFIAVEDNSPLFQNPSTKRFPDITPLSDKDVLNILTKAKRYFSFKLLPDYFFWFGEKHPDCFNDFQNSPELYTGIDKVSFDKGGLILLNQLKHRKRLLTSQGDPITHFFDANNDSHITLGIKGMVLYNFFDDRMHEWDYINFVVRNDQLKKLPWTDQGGGLRYKMNYFDDSYFFPPGNRDIIDEMLPEEEKLTTSLDFSQPVTGQQLEEELQRNPNAEIFFRDQYYNLKTLAAIVLKHKPIAYSCLSRKLQNDRSFILDLIKNKNLQALYPYLRPNLKADREILEQCIYKHPEYLMELEPIQDKKLIKDFILNHNYKIDYYGNKRERTVPLSYASEKIRSDRHFVLQIMAEYPDCFHHASETIKKDKEFILDAIKFKPDVILYLHKELQKDADIIKESVKQGWDPYRDQLSDLPF